MLALQWVHLVMTYEEKVGLPQKLFTKKYDPVTPDILYPLD